MSKEYQRGYAGAMDCITIDGYDPQEMFDQCPMAEDDFDKGWQQACIEAGAVDPN